MASKVIAGIPVSAGISLGKAYFINRHHSQQIPRFSIPDETVEEEMARLANAFEQAQQELSAIRDKVPPDLREHAALIDSHLMMLADPKLRASAAQYVRTMRLNAEWALEKAVGDLEAAFSVVDDPYIRERIQDVRIVAGRVQTRLIGQDQTLKAIEGRVILMAHDLTPADTIEIEVDKIMAFATVQGGKTSHTGILARSLRIPAIVGATGLEESIKDGQFVIIDGLRGVVIVDPSEDEIAHYSEVKYQFETYQASIIRCCHLPGETIDGYRIQVLANVEIFEEVAAVLDSGGEGIGLYRTEYSYLSRVRLPEEEELVEEYRDLASIMAPRRVTLRTLDIGADKFMTEFGSLEESNPALGLRAIRFCLRHKELFKTQLRAILRASVSGNVSIMFPMISGLKELRQAMGLLREAQTELKREGLPFDKSMPVGIMVELPSAVMMAEILAKEVDFFSIGTNDLIQYSLGIDRTNRHVSYLYQPLHPAIVRSIKRTVDAAHQAGIEVSLCGEVASDPFCVPILMGMQIDCISMNPQAIPGIKRIIRQANMDECKQLLKMVLDSRTVARTNRLVKEIIFQRFPEELTFYSSILDNDEP